MKKLVMLANKIALLTVLMLMAMLSNVKADEIHRVTATSYCIKENPTASNTQPRYGVVAGKREWLGSTMVIWLDDGDGQIKPENYYGTFSCEDLGGSQAIKDGIVIDIFLNTYEESVNFGSKKMIIQIIESEG